MSRDRNDRLIGEGLDEFNLLLAKRANRKAEQADDTKGLSIPNERYAERRPETH